MEKITNSTKLKHWTTTINEIIDNVNTIIPEQTGMNGKFLTTNGENVSWSAIPTNDSINTNSSTEIASSKAVKTAYDKAVSVESSIPTKLSQLQNDSKYQTEAQVAATVSQLVDSAPETLDTLNELAQALGNDPNFATTMATELGKKTNTTDLATVATSGSYNDLSNTPTIPSVGNGTLTIQKNGTSAGTFTANATTDKTINIIVPTKVSELTDDVVKGKYLSLTGGTMTGNININNKTITNLKTPTADTEAANKKYVDDQIAANSPSTTIITWSDDGT